MTQEMEKLMKELEMQNKKELEYAKMQHELQIENMRISQKTQEQYNSRNEQELMAMKQRIAEYENQLRKEADLLNKYMKQLETKNDTF